MQSIIKSPLPPSQHDVHALEAENHGSDQRNYDFGTSAGTTGKTYAARKGIQIVTDEPYSQGSPDYRSTVTDILEALPGLCKEG